MAIASTTMPHAQTDETSLITAFATAMVETRGAKGSGASTGTRLDHFTDEAGVEAAQNAINAIGGERVPSGTYTVVFGTPARGGSAEQHRDPRLHGELVLLVEHALPRQARAARSPRRACSVYDDGARPRLHGVEGDHVRGTADRDGPI